MTSHQQPTATLTSLDAALGLLLRGLAPVAPIDLAFADAIGCIAAPMPPLGEALPAHNVATIDGWALRSVDLVGASSYAPVPLAAVPAWVEVGDELPDGCDCVLDAAAVERVGPMLQALAEAIPGAGVRRAGEDLAADARVSVAGRRITSLDVLTARRAGLQGLAVRRPRVHLINVPATDGVAMTADVIVARARAAGAHVTRADAGRRDAVAIAAAIKAADCDLLIIVGGTGAGHHDATGAALAAGGASLIHDSPMHDSLIHDSLIHGVAVQPGRTVAIGRTPGPVIALPGAPDHALAVWWTLGQPVLDALSGRLARRSIVRPLTRKIASGVGMSEIVLLKDTEAGWLPLAIGDLPLSSLALADAWLAVPSGSEGYATGHPVGAYPLREWS
jgi:molybdopterin molybdotransferase